MRCSFLNVILILLCMIPAVSYAQEKVVDESGDKPEWVDNTMPEYIIVSTTAPELMKAQTQCMDLVRQEIINSVAVNINSSSSTSSTQTFVNDDNLFKSEFSSELKVVAARLPFITGISISNAETYWEKIYIKKEKKYFYRCHLKYPYSDMTKRKLVLEFKLNDEKKSKQLEMLKSQYDNISSVEEIGSCIIELKSLSEYFFDGVRKSETRLLLEKYNDLYKQISVLSVSNVPGNYVFKLMLHDKVITCSKMPRLKSDYVMNLAVTMGDVDKSYSVTYDYKGCSPDEPNIVEMFFYFGNKNMKFEFRADLSGTVADVKFPGFINIFLKENKKDVFNYRVEMDILAGEGSNFLIDEVCLNLKELKEPLILNSEEEFLNQGLQHYKFSGISKNVRTDIKGTLTDGYLKIKNNKTKRVETIKISRPYKLVMGK